MFSAYTGKDESLCTNVLQKTKKIEIFISMNLQQSLG